ncbi:MAG: hypothetical protein LE169_03860 [Endomicrobium sp.]|nr:hypothetical protein [Endomicrobium sp.]MCA6080008.1 hypothetical protein [Endomicrobium sp.]
MKKIICICICICLMSGCDKSLSHGRPANAVVEDTGSEATHSLPSDTSISGCAKQPAGEQAPINVLPSSPKIDNNVVLDPKSFPATNVIHNHYKLINKVKYGIYCVGAFIVLLLSAHVIFNYKSPKPKEQKKRCYIGVSKEYSARYKAAREALHEGDKAEYKRHMDELKQIPADKKYRYRYY